MVVRQRLTEELVSGRVRRSGPRYENQTGGSEGAGGVKKRDEEVNRRTQVTKKRIGTRKQKGHLLVGPRCESETQQGQRESLLYQPLFQKEGPDPYRLGDSSLRVEEPLGLLNSGPNYRNLQPPLSCSFDGRDVGLVHGSCPIGKFGVFL